MFSEKPVFSRLLLILVLIGAVCTLLLLFQRARSELASRRVACAVAYADAAALAEADGRSAELWLQDLHAAGVSYLIVRDADGPEAEAAAERSGMTRARMGDSAGSGDAFLIPAVENAALVTDTLDLTDAPALAAAEDLLRIGVLVPWDLLDALPCPVVKTLVLFDRYRSCDHSETPYSESCNILFRAVTERGMRLLVLQPLTDPDGAVVTDPAVYTKLLSDLGERIAARGLSLGDSFSTLDAPAENRYLLSGALFLVAAAAILLVYFLFPSLPDGALTAVLAACAAAAAAAGFVRPSLSMTGGAFAAALIGGCFAAAILRAAWVSPRSERNLFLAYGKTLLRLLLCGLCFGLMVGGLLACRTYMLGFTVFRGVKAAQFAPLLAAAAVCIASVYRDPSAKRPTGRRRTAAIVCAAVVLAAAAALVLLRSGDAGGFVSQLETDARNWLERVLFVRPRTKEMLAAVPAAALFVFACRRRLPLLAILTGVLSALETVSVINTFCHIVTPLHVSLIRALLGAVFGFLIGCILLWLCQLLFPEKRSE